MTEHKDSKEEDTQNQRIWIARVLIAFGVMAAAIALVYAYFQFVWSDTALLSQRHLDVEKRVEVLTSQMKNFMETTTKNMESMLALQQKLEKEVASNGSPQKSDDQTAQALNELRQKLDKIEQDFSLRQDQMAKIPQSLGLFEKLHDRMQSSRPYEKELQEAMFLFDPADKEMQQRLATLMASAKTGVPSVEQLEESFKAMEPDLMRLSIPDDLPWYDQLAKRIRNLVIIRKHGESLTSASSVEDRISGIQQLLEQRNIEDAVTEVELLPKFTYEPYVTWCDWAQKRLYIEQSLPIMEAHVLAHMVSVKQNSTSRRE